MAIKQLNQLPVPTFSWLEVNGIERDVPDSASAVLNVNASRTEITRLDVAENTEISVQMSGTVIMRIAEGCSSLNVSCHAGYGEKLRLVQIYEGGSAAANLSADLDDTAELELIQIYLHTKDTAGAVTVTMNGRKSVFSSDIAYLLEDDNALDINLNVIQGGRKTTSVTDVKGVLRGNAKKTFRGTIDFRNGSAGSAGTEREDVLLIGGRVKSKTVPVILCAEEDVAGNHGASVGQIDAKHIFYMQSRGIPEDKIYEMIALSKLGSVIRKISDAETEQRIQKLIGTEGEDA